MVDGAVRNKIAVGKIKYGKSILTMDTDVVTFHPSIQNAYERQTSHGGVDNGDRIMVKNV